MALARASREDLRSAAVRWSEHVLNKHRHEADTRAYERGRDQREPGWRGPIICPTASRRLEAWDRLVVAPGSPQDRDRTRRSRKSAWLRDELILALDLYRREGRNPSGTAVREISESLRMIPIERDLAEGASF